MLAAALMSLASCIGPQARVVAEPQFHPTAVGAPLQAGSDPAAFLPDLIALPPRQLYIRISPETGRRELRFSTTIVNVGDGPLDLWGRHDPRSGKTVATQRIATVKGTVDRLAGSFVYHRGHEHWHFESFTMFELLTLQNDGSLGSVAATTGKMTFCIRDSEHVNPALPHAAPKRVFNGCEQNVQGISVGWGDLYRAKTPGQSLDLRRVPDGVYAIRSTSDPENRLAEKDETNNATTGFVELRGMRVRVLSIK